ncbi:hypothetical protein [Nostoc sp. CCY 9925]|uniref:hypothetical protein n=1 Tax=Nostoc sp. CCY 9925 TaxID=3103865 RepID=UPI0039C5D2FF
MSDYLSNLAARSLSLTPVIQPRLASLFESYTAVSEESIPFVETEAIASQQQEANTIVEKSPQVVSPKTEAKKYNDIPQKIKTSISKEGENEEFITSSSSISNSQFIPAPLLEANSSVEYPKQSLLNPQVNIVNNHTNQIASENPVFSPIPPLSPPIIKEVINQSDKLPEAPSQRQNITESRLTTTQKATSPTPHSVETRLIASLPTPHSPPTIRVTIGRIDVRAVTPPAPKQITRTPAAPKLSLDDYLKSCKVGNL